MEFKLEKKWDGNIRIRQNHLNKSIRFDIETEKEFEFDNLLKSLKEGDKIIIKKDE